MFWPIQQPCGTSLIINYFFSYVFETSWTGYNIWYDILENKLLNSLGSFSWCFRLWCAIYFFFFFFKKMNKEINTFKDIMMDGCLQTLLSNPCLEVKWGSRQGHALGAAGRRLSVPICWWLYWYAGLYQVTGKTFIYHRAMINSSSCHME